MFQAMSQQIKKYFNRRNILFILFISTLSFSFYDISFADQVSEGAMQARKDQGLNPITGGAQNTLVIGASETIKGVGSLLAILSSLVTLLLHPSWYNGEIFSLNVYLKEIWILVSNVVYFIFAILLVWVALMNIIGKGGDYELKKQLPKFIVGILIVPFSWFIIQFMISISSVLAAAVLSLPSETFKNFEANKAFYDTVEVCVDNTIDLGGSVGKNDGKNPSGGGAYVCKTHMKISELFGKTGKGVKNEGFYGIMSIYISGVLNLEGLDKISLKQIGEKGGINNLLNLGLKAIMDVIFVIVYLILLFALFLALFVRGVQIWLYMMISPLFGLFYYLGGSASKLGGLGKFNLKNFIHLAMVPVYVSAALSFGLLFIAVVDHGAMNAKGGIMTGCEGNNADNCVMEVGGIKLTIKGALGKDRGGGGSGDSQGPKMSGNPLGYLIMQMFSIVVLWVAIMAALNTSELTKSVIKPFEEFGSHVGGVVQKLPQYTPIPFTGGFSPTQMKDVAGDIARSIERGSDTNRIEKMKGNPLLSRFVNENTELNAKLRRDMNNDNNDVIKSNVSSIMSNYKNYDQIKSSPDAKAYLEERSGGIKLNNEKGLIDAIKEIGKKTNNSTWRTFSGTRYEELRQEGGSNTNSQSSNQNQTNNVNIKIFADHTHEVNFGGTSMNLKKGEQTEADITNIINGNSQLKPKLDEILRKLRETEGFFKRP